MSKLELYYPVKKPDLIWNQFFGENMVGLYKQMGLKGHNGIDFYALDGYPVYAAHDGEVTFSGEDGSAGLGVVIRTLEPKEYGQDKVYFKTIYWHLKRGSIKVKAGSFVKAGDIIAEADNTGASSGSHLHFGLKPIMQGESDWTWYNLEQNNGYMGAIDPKPYFNGVFAQDVQVHGLLEKIVGILNEVVNLLAKKK